MLSSSARSSFVRIFCTSSRSGLSSITRAPTVSRRPCTCPSFPSCASSSSFSRVARCAPSCSSSPWCSRSRRSLRAHGLRPGGAPGWCSRIEAVARSRARGRSSACRAIRGPAAAWWNHRPANQPALRPSVSIRRAVASDGQPADAGIDPRDQQRLGTAPELPRAHGDSPGGLMYVTHDRKAPRTHGDDPGPHAAAEKAAAASPHARGCTLRAKRSHNSALEVARRY